MKNSGFIAPQIVTEGEKAHYVLGALPQVILQADRNWLPFTAEFEPQQKKFETYNCTGFNTLTAIETLLARLGIHENYSDRWVGIIAGTKAPGNDPHTVAEAIRKNGLIPESMLPFSDDLNSVDEYYSFKGADEAKCREVGQKWLERFDFGHEWVFLGGDNKPEKMLEALQFSPLDVSVQAWHKDGILFSKPKGGADNHWTCNVVGVNEKKYWIIDDSYLDDGQPLKYLEWDYDFGFCKRYSIVVKKDDKAKKAVIWQILQYLAELIGLLPKESLVVAPILEQPESPVPAEPVKSKPMLDIFCSAIRDYEGKPGDRNYRNNNPGNVKFSSVGYLIKYEPVKKDKEGFAIFKDYETGWLYLQNLVRSKIAKNPQRTIREFFYEYAPPSENEPELYAKFVAKRCGVNVDFIIKNLL